MLQAGKVWLLALLAGAGAPDAPSAEHLEREGAVSPRSDGFSSSALPPTPGASFAGSTPAPKAEPVVKVERDAGVFRIEADMSVRVDPATAWDVLTDYNHLAEFMPDMRESRVVSGPGEPVLVEQKAMTGFLVFRFPIEVLLKVEESPCSRVAFQSIKGNVKELRGEWRIAGDRSPITILYVTHLKPDFWVPPLVGSALIREDVQAQMIGLAREMIRRKEQRVRSVACASGTAGP